MSELIERVLLLGRVEAFAGLTTEQLSLLGLVAQRDECVAGAVIYAAGAPPGAMYLVQKGRVLLERDGALIGEARAGEDFGTWALFDPEPRVTSARAATDTTLLRIDRQRFEELVEEHPDLAHGILRSLARRVRTLTGMIEAGNGGPRRDGRI
jgi:CRP/FNR family cyclic AMP-dependent transcriptional regulator